MLKIKAGIFRKRSVFLAIALLGNNLFEFVCLRKRLFTFYHHCFCCRCSQISSCFGRLFLDPRMKKTQNKTHKHTHSGAENSLFQFCLTITKPFPPIYLEEMKSLLIKSQRFTRRYSGNYTSLQAPRFSSTEPQGSTLTYYYNNIIGDELLLNFESKFQR